MEIRLTEGEEDKEFLFRVYSSSREEEMSLWGWFDDQKQQFLYMQHEAQQRFYRQQYPKLRYQIILVDGEKAGRVAIVEMEKEFVLVDIILLPEYQNRGIGTWFLQKLQGEALDKNMSVRLSVLNDSRARALYERFGFRAIEDSDVYTIMKWNGQKSQL